LNQNGKGKAAGSGSRIAIVTPWFGPNLRGGAEKQSWQLAEHLTAHGHAVDVLTTCCRSFADDWGTNTLRAGVERQGALTIRRFRTDRRDRRAFERVNSILLGLGQSQLHRGVSPVGDADAESFCRNSINSSALYSYLSSAGATYDHILFIPYMFGTTFFGLPLVAERAFLQPCLHSEAYAYLPRVAATVHAAKGLLFNSDGEFEVAISLFGPGIVSKSFVVGEGIDVFTNGRMLPKRVGDFVPEGERYVLYIGRQDPAKNVATLVAAFKGFRRSAPASRLKLVFAGERHVSYADSGAGIVDLGPVTEDAKTVLLEHCRALAQPSLNESFSRVIYEAWAMGRPVVVHADCPPTASVVTRCGGGYLADSTSAWEKALRTIESAPDEALDELGRRGSAYARETTPWPAVIDRYEHAFAASAAQSPATKSRWDNSPDLPLIAALADGKTNLLYAGPITSIEHIDELLVMFLHFLTLERESRLAIAATPGTDPAVYDELQSEVRRLDLVDRLLVTREPADVQLQAFYLGADIFISLDRSDAGLAQMRDALWFDVPILALDTPAHRKLASESAILIRDTGDLLAIAALTELLAKDVRLRGAVIAAQRRVRSALEPQREPGVDVFSRS
jgi:glycosyltransferase involved in cell wall biosynthesis